MTSSIVVEGLLLQIAAGSTDAATILVDAIEEGVEAPKGVLYVYLEEDFSFAVVTPDKTIRLVGNAQGYDDETGMRVCKGWDRTFSVGGDEAEYDSYNLSYHAPIMSITAKTVACGNRRLKLQQFNWRNKDFDLATAVKTNHMEMVRL